MVQKGTVRGSFGLMLQIASIKAETATPAAPEIVPEPAAQPHGDEDLREASEGFDCRACGRAEADCSADPCEAVQDDRDEGTAADVVDAETVAAVAVETAPTVDEAGPDVVKLLTVYDQAVWAIASDWRDASRTMLRRVRRDGTPFTERETAGGSWQRVHRDNIKREVLPRGGAAKAVPVQPAQPVAAAQPVDTGMADRLAQLERIVAGLAGIAPAAMETAPAGPDPRDAEIERLSGALARAEADRDVLAGQLEHVKGERDGLWRRRGIARRVVRRAVAIRADRNAAHALLRITQDETAAAERKAAILQLRCDALERLGIDSAVLDFRPADAVPATAIVLPSPSSARR